MRNKGKVILVDDEPMICLAAEQALTLAGFEVHCFSSADELCKETLKQDWPGIIISDVKMPGMDGVELLSHLQKQDKDLPVILITGHGDIELAVSCIQQGAYDFLEKPFASEQLVDVVRRAMDKRNLVLDNRALRIQLLEKDSDCLLIGESAAMQGLKSSLQTIAETNADVLIYGETGTGKDLVARCIHALSNQRSGHFVAINCGAMPEAIFENELYGHVRGAFTGANKNRVGKFEYANHGTFLLDEIESMPIDLQVKLLRVIQERTVEKLGSNKSIALDIRIIATTKDDLLQASVRGTFREDLYYRLNVVTLQLPTLHERSEDIPELFRHFYINATTRLKREPETLSEAFLKGLKLYHWPGNVRELRNHAERIAMGFSSEPWDAGLLSPVTQNEDKRLLSHLDKYEKYLLIQELTRQGGNITQTYTTLGISRKTLYDKMQKYQLKRSQFISQ